MTLFMSGITYDYDLRVRNFEPKEITFKTRPRSILFRAMFILLFPIVIIVIHFTDPFSSSGSGFALYLVAPLFFLGALWELYGLKGSRNLSVNEKGFTWTGYFGPQQFQWKDCSEFRHPNIPNRQGRPKISWNVTDDFQDSKPKIHMNIVNNTDLQLDHLCIIMNLYRAHAMEQN